MSKSEDYIIMTFFGVILLGAIAFIGLGVAMLSSDIYKSYTTEYKDYTVKLHYLNGDVTTETFRLPDNIHLQINCHSHKGNFKSCNLEYVNTDTIGSHWHKVIAGVNRFELKFQEPVQKQ